MVTSRKSTEGSLGELTLFEEDSHVKTSVWLDAVLDWLGEDPDCSTNSCALLVRLLPVGFSSRTCLDFCHRTADETWEPSLGRWGPSGMGGATVCLTLNTSDWPKGASVCSLSDVLETCEVPQKYYLSQRACAGILRRAEARGRELPSALAQALQAVATPVEGRTEGSRSTS